MEGWRTDRFNLRGRDGREIASLVHQQVRRHFDQEGIHAVAAEIGGPQEVLPGDVEVGFRLLGISVTAATGCVGIRHDRRHDERIV